KTIIPDARQESDGSISAPCFVCADEGRHDKRIKIFVGANGKITAVSCNRFAASGLREANRAHCKPYYELLNVSASASAWIDGKLTLQCDSTKKDRSLTVALNCDKILARDEINLNRGDQRASFIKSIADFTTDEQRAEIAQALLRMADRRESVRAATGEDGED